MSSVAPAERSRGKRRRWLIAALLAVTVVVAAAVAWGPIGDWRDERSARTLLGQFREALLDGDYRGACGLLAATAPPRDDGEANCPDRLRERRSIAEWPHLLNEIDANIEERDGDRLYVAAVEGQATFLDAGPTYRFTLVREDGDLRIEHLAGYF